VAILATAVLTGSAYAQRQGGFGRGGGGGAGQLLRMPEVQTELKLSDDQKTKITAWAETQRGQRGQGGGQDLSPEERAARRAEQRAKETEALKKILNEDQMKRLKQLTLQRAGLSALGETPVQEELKLTSDQKSKVDAVLQEQRAAMREAFQDGGGGDPQAARAKMEEMRKKSNEKLEAILTADQKTQWKAMLGTPFTFPAPNFNRARANDAT
jgi:hypothetical protein